MTNQHRKMSEMLKEMSEVLLQNPDATHSPEAAHIALMFANIAWNESVGLVHPREGYRSAWEAIEAENPELWNEFKSTDVNAIIDELVEYKKARYANDQRRILVCGMIDGKLRVEWLPPAAPGVDSKWEMELFGLVKTGQQKKAVRFLQKTRGLSRLDHPFQAVSVLGSTLAAVFPRVLNVGFRSIPGKPSRSSPKHAISGRKSDSLKGMVALMPRKKWRSSLSKPEHL